MQNQRILGRAFSLVAAMQAAQVWNAAEPQRKTALLSAGGKGAGAMWTATGLGPRRMFHNAHFREAMRLRLGVSTAPPGTTCQLHRETAKDEAEPVVCGELMETGLLIHPLLCKHGAARNRPHRALSRAVGRLTRAAGACVDYERHIPELYQWEENS